MIRSKNFNDFKEGFDMELLAAALKRGEVFEGMEERIDICLLYTSPSPRD